MSSEASATVSATVTACASDAGDVSNDVTSIADAGTSAVADAGASASADAVDIEPPAKLKAVRKPKTLRAHLAATNICSGKRVRVPSSGLTFEDKIKALQRLATPPVIAKGTGLTLAGQAPHDPAAVDVSPKLDVADLYRGVRVQYKVGLLRNGSFVAQPLGFFEDIGLTGSAGSEWKAKRALFAKWQQALATVIQSHNVVWSPTNTCVPKSASIDGVDAVQVAQVLVKEDFLF